MDVSKFREMQAEYHQMLTKHGRSAMESFLKQLFEDHSWIEKLRWVQYTPAWNDGEACVFSVGSPTFVVKGGVDGIPGHHQEEVDSDDGFMEEYQVPRGQPLWDEMRKVCAKFRDIPDDLFEAAFGDGSRITADKDGFTVEEYDNYN